MDRLDERALQRISAPSWTPLRPEFEKIHNSLIGVSESANAELTTIYIKYVDLSRTQKPFAVVWVKTPSEIVVGLALPQDEIPVGLLAPPVGFTYGGLTGYFRVKAGDVAPYSLAELARIAHGYVANE